MYVWRRRVLKGNTTFCFFKIILPKTNTNVDERKEKCTLFEYSSRQFSVSNIMTEVYATLRPHPRPHPPLLIVDTRNSVRRLHIYIFYIINPYLVSLFFTDTEQISYTAASSKYTIVAKQQQKSTLSTKNLRHLTKLERSNAFLMIFKTNVKRY